MRQEATKSDVSKRLSEILPTLTENQLRYVIARQSFPTKKEAIEAIGLKRQSIYHWPEIVEEAVQLVALEALESAKLILKRYVTEATMVKVAGLGSKNEQTRQRIASEILDRVLGKAMERAEIGSGTGRPLQLEVIEVIEHLEENES